MTIQYGPNSIVDTLKQQGQASDFASRTKLAADMGIQNYTGTASQNMSLLNKINAQKSIVQTTSQVRNQDQKNIDTLNEKTGNVQPTGVVQGNVQPTTTPNANNTPTTAPNAPTPTVAPTPTGYTDAPPTGFSYNLPTLEKGKYVYGSDGRPYVDMGDGKLTNDPNADAMWDRQKKLNDDIKTQNELYDTYKQGLDQSHISLIDSIKTMAAQQKAKMEELNKRTLGTKKVQGFRTGGTEYTGEVYTGILKAEEEEGLARLAEIDANMKSAIAQAVMAKNDKDFELLNKRISNINALQKAKEETVQQIFQNYINNQKLIDQRIKEAESEERAQSDQAMQELKVSAPALVKQYDLYKTQAEKDAFITAFAKKSGLAPEVILGQLEQTRVDNKEKKTSGSKPTESERKDSQLRDLRSGLTVGTALDANGYLKPTAFEYMLKNTGLSRKDLIEELGGYMYLSEGNNPYKLTAKELSDLGQ